ncbi:MAG: nucleotide sugar dehydrogenase [Phycisphaerales bacterium]
MAASGDDGREALARLIAGRGARVAVIGLGYVGLPLLDAVAGAGFGAIGLDHDEAKIEMLRGGRSYLPHLGEGLASRLAGNADVELTSDPARLGDADVVLICVPTPLDGERRPDLSAVERAAEEIRAHAIDRDSSRPRLIVLESTTYPGTTRDVVAPIVRGAGGGGAVFVAFSPEREDPGNKAHTTRTIPKLVGGVDEASGALAGALYGAVVREVVMCSGAEVAEGAKLVENVYRSVNIALVNELKIAFSAMGLDVWEVLDAAATKPFGFQRFDPGPGFGGHCVPIDPYYLADAARRHGFDTRFIELAGEVNRAMPGYVVDRCADALASRQQTLGGARVLVLGIAYKKNIADVRESPAFEVIGLLRERGAEVSYHDPFVAATKKMRRHDPGLTSIAWDAGTLAGFDCVVIVTDHDWYDWAFVGEHARLIVDTRHAMGRAGLDGGGKVFPA